VSSERPIVFGNFRLDLTNQCLWRNEQSIPIPPKEFAVLLYLLRNPGRLVTKDELIEAVWPETAVTDGVLKVSIRKIRVILDDDSKSPRFIETAHRRGYRFIATVDEPPPVKPDRSETANLASATPQRFSGAYRLSDFTTSTPSGLIGREQSLGRLREWLKRAMSGERQTVFVTGEAGIGKTTLVEAFLQNVRTDSRALIAQGQCLEQYGSGEAYLPVLEALSRLCQETDQARMIELLRRHAPTWLQQMPWLIDEAERANLKSQVIGATRERMVREMAEALEELTSTRGLVFVLEDLHWSDYSTLDLLSYIARRRKPAKLLVLATYRPVDATLSEHPLGGVKQDLQAHRQCEELALEYLGSEAINQYLAARFPLNEFPEGLAGLLHNRTEGNPFFFINAVDYLQAQGLIAEADARWQLTVPLSQLSLGVPESIRQMIENQIAGLDRQLQRVLETAAVTGVEFPAAAIAFGMEEDLTTIEETCEELERRHRFLRATGIGTLPNRTVTARYTFTHALYQEVLYDRVAPWRRVRLHQLIGERGEEAYGERAADIAAELAMHFELGHDYRRAVKHLRQAAQNHFLRFANREAIAYLMRALGLLEHWPEWERTGARIALLEQAGLARLAMGDMAGAAGDFEALREYARIKGVTKYEVRALDNLATALSWIDREECLAAAKRSLALSDQLSDELLQAHARGCWGYWQVLFVDWADEHAKAVGEAADAARKAGDRSMLGLHLARCSFMDCLRSEYRKASEAADEATGIALELSNAHTFLLSRYYRAWSLLHHGQWGDLLRIVGERGDGLQMAERNEHKRWAVLFRLELAWLHEQAFDFERARELCQLSFEQARELVHPYTETLSQILMANAYLGLEKRGMAFQCFKTAMGRLGDGRSLMDWVLRMPLNYGLSRYWLAEGKTAEARREAQILHQLAGAPSERTYVALAFQTLAEVAIAEENRSAAESFIKQALEVIESGDAPLAEWRVCATAASLFEGSDQAAYLWRRSTESLYRLAFSLGDAGRLRQTLLTNPVTRNIQQHAVQHQKSQ
jgi:DNA-binding winged helix-turn-helix (wHTH) protein